MAVWLKGDRKLARELFHEQHLARSLDGAIQPALIMRRKASVLSREDAALVRDKLLQQIDAFEIQRVNRKINLWLRAGSPDLIRGATAFFGFIWAGFSGHRSYLISR